MAKRRLMTPGPTQVPEEALLALARQVTHHRTAEFRSLLAEVLEGLKYVFATENDVLVLTSSGTGAMSGRIFRIAHMGILDELDILSTIAAIELVLVEMQQPVKLGTAAAAAGRILADGPNPAK